MVNGYKFTALTGGGSGALDAQDGAALVDKDIAIVMESGSIYFYELDASSGAAENSPSVIEPDTNAGDKRWLLVSEGGLEAHKSSGDHDGRYYTKSEDDSLLNTHKSSGDHDGRYYTKSQNDSLLNTHKSSGDHDDRYNARRKGQVAIINSGANPKSYLMVNNNALDWRSIVLPVPAGLHVDAGGIVSVTVLDDNGNPPDTISYTVNADVITIVANTSGASESLKLYIDALIVYGS